MSLPTGDSQVLYACVLQGYLHVQMCGCVQLGMPWPSPAWGLFLFVADDGKYQVRLVVYSTACVLCSSSALPLYSVPRFLSSLLSSPDQITPTQYL